MDPDTLADVIGFPLAAPVHRFPRDTGQPAGPRFRCGQRHLRPVRCASRHDRRCATRRDALPRAQNALRLFTSQLVEGWQFLRQRKPLIQNTLISTIAQLQIGVTLALTVVYARDTLNGSVIPYPDNYAAIETAVGVGSLIGGVAVGLIGARVRKGWLVIGGFVVMGFSTVVLGLTSNVLLALVAAGVEGAANLGHYIIPTQTIFIEMTPVELLGRVVAFRSSLVFGAMTMAMAIASLLAESIDAGLVIAAFGALTMTAGLIGALLPAVRDPDRLLPSAESPQPALQ